VVATYCNLSEWHCDEVIIVYDHTKAIQYPPNLLWKVYKLIKDNNLSDLLLTVSFTRITFTTISYWNRKLECGRIATFYLDIAN